MAEVSKSITDSDNVMLEQIPSKEEVFSSLKSSNLKAAAGSDGIPGLLYVKCWDALGESLYGVIHELFVSEPLTTSMRTAMMIFSPKPKKISSTKPGDKRRLSICNTDFKTYEGIIAKRFRELTGRILSPHQFVGGKDRNIQHGIAKARDAIFAANASNIKCGIGDQDFISAFDFLVLSWSWMVLEKKGLGTETLVRLRRLYDNGITILVVNGVQGRAIHDRRGVLRQGGGKLHGLVCHWN